MKTIHEVEQYAASRGIILTQSDREEITRIQLAEQQRLKQRSNLVDRFNDFYPRLLSFISSAGDTVITLTQTFIVSLGVPITLLLLLIVEHQRVVHGIEMFEADLSLARFAASTLVLLNLILEFQVHYIEHRAGYQRERDRVWSLRIMARNVAYRLGIGDQWVEREKSPAEQYRNLLRLVTFSILTLALLGSMKTAIANATGTWNEAVVRIITQSNLTEMMTWIGGLLFALAAVLSAQGLSRYVAMRCVEILQVKNSSQDISEQAAAMAALAIVNAKIEKREEKKRAQNPFGNSVRDLEEKGYTKMTANGNGRGG